MFPVGLFTIFLVPSGHDRVQFICEAQPGIRERWDDHSRHRPSRYLGYSMCGRVVTHECLERINVERIRRSTQHDGHDGFQRSDQWIDTTVMTTSPRATVRHDAFGLLNRGHPAAHVTLWVRAIVVLAGTTDLFRSLGDQSLSFRTKTRV